MPQRVSVDGAASRTCTVCGGLVDPAKCLRWSKDGWDILRCPACGLVFRSVLPEAAELHDIYAEKYFLAAGGDVGGQGYADYVGEAELHREAARDRLRLLSRYVSPGRLLDVGAAAGFFVDEAGRAGWDARGIDIAPSMVEWGRERLGVRLENAALVDSEIAPASLAAVTMWDYIEHATDPRGDVGRAFRLLQPGGLLALSTGDVDSLAARISGRRWHLLTPRHHNYYFSGATLRRMLESADYEIVWLGHPGHRYTLRYLAHKGRTLVDVAPLRALSNFVSTSRIGAVRIPVNLEDIVTVVARKPLDSGDDPADATVARAPTEA